MAVDRLLIDTAIQAKMTGLPVSLIFQENGIFCQSRLHEYPEGIVSSAQQEVFFYGTGFARPQVLHFQRGAENMSMRVGIFGGLVR